MVDIEEKKRAKLERQQREEEERRKKKEEEAAKMKAMAQATGGAVGKDGAAGEDASWLAKDIVVKIINKTLADGKYYKRKGYVKSLADAYTANVRLLDSKTTLRLDQAYLETVIPSVGGHVLILHGPHANCLGKLKDIDYDKFSADIKVLEGSGKGTRVMLPYEHFSKFYEPKA
ncbi:hypothetical protein PTSG_10174 [Salpingoeca rosetta]|uniref:Uncharacterized protein n=1 Tax=Salpingoeca rosetta (strain ATCC 50818 / BSB-021) TaxID=946362 RepID=F2UQI5_SALR5|nr:uncharacterized protein PTSG_10174 [Salpingoeca rosetta]EGD79890.1 hypothetical protein PTSG_10174 [Salpingoeca rosetta]|eukprot:XP_004988511.1 hypothetical protein PTSG_10174 [Salpingoeca rosetta]